MKVIKENKGKVVAGTGTAGIIIAIIMNFQNISDELQEWFYMAKGEQSSVSSSENVSPEKYVSREINQKVKNSDVFQITPEPNTDIKKVKRPSN